MPIMGLMSESSGRSPARTGREYSSAVTWAATGSARPTPVSYGAKMVAIKRPFANCDNLRSMDFVRCVFEGICARMLRYSVIVCVLSVSAVAADAEPPPALSDAVQSYIYRYITDVVHDETFRFALEDLDGDGRADAIVLMSDPAWCGSGGCTMLIFRGVENGFEFVSKSTITNPPIRVSRKAVRGWRTLIVSSKGKGDVALRLNKSLQYPGNPSMQPKASRAKVDAADLAIE